MSRRFFAVLAAIALLFAQGVASAYACSGPVMDPVAMAQMKAAMSGDGGLCEKHCTTGVVAPDVAKPATFAMPAVVAVSWRIAAAPAQPVSTTTRPAARLAAGPAPPLIRFTVLRI
jgi:hypothetical protein